MNLRNALILRLNPETQEQHEIAASHVDRILRVLGFLLTDYAIQQLNPGHLGHLLHTYCYRLHGFSDDELLDILGQSIRLYPDSEAKSAVKQPPNVVALSDFKID